MASMLKSSLSLGGSSEMPVDDLTGPAENEISLSSRALYMKPQLIFLRESHMRYQLSELSHFDRYIIFKYTLQSWQVNEHLAGAPSSKSIGGDPDIVRANKVIWARDFFFNY